MKHLFFSLILFLTSCSLSKEDNVYWNKVLSKESNEAKKITVILKKKQLLNSLREKYGDNKTMSFDEFNIFLKDYSNKAEYPIIN